MRIQVFARAPEPGKAKTRLIPALGPQGAASLHERLVRRTLTIALSACPSGVELWCAPDPGHAFFTECARRYGVRLRLQEGATLGERMLNALDDAAGRDERAVLVGTDCPELDVEYLREAMSRLDEGVDLVLGPAHDGGYVLIGAGRTDATLFNHMPWGGSRVLQETLSRARIAGLTVHLLRAVADLDRPEDLARFPDINDQS